MAIVASPTYAQTIGRSKRRKYGVGTSGSGSATQISTNNHQQAWAGMLEELNLDPGTYTISDIVFTCGATNTGDCGAATLAICSLSGSTFATVATIDTTSGLVSGSSNYDLTAGSLASEITLLAGVKYYIGGWLRCEAARAGSPTLRTMGNTSAGPTGAYVFTSCAAPFQGASFPATFQSTDASASNANVQLLTIRFTTLKNTLFSISSSAFAASGGTLKKLIPYSDEIGERTTIILKGAVCADGQSLTMVGNFENNNNASNDLFTAALSFGAASNPADDTLTFAATPVTLGQAHPEHGKTLNFLIQTRPLAASTRGNMFWQDASLANGQGPGGTADLATFSHATKSSGSRFTGRAGYLLDAANARGCEWLEISSTDGNAVIAELRVSAMTYVPMGASNYGNGVGDPTLAQGLAGAAFIAGLDMPYWGGAMGNNAYGFTAGGRTAVGYRYAALTPGLGDLCEMWDTLVSFGDVGGNDLKSNNQDPTPVSVTNGVPNQSGGGILTLANAAPHIAMVSAALSYALAQGLAWDTTPGERGNCFLLIGLHKNWDPNNIAGVTDEAWAAMTRSVNGTASAYFTWYFNPYQGTLDHGVDEYIRDDGNGVHFTEEGGQWLFEQCLAAMQADISGSDTSPTGGSLNAGTGYSSIVLGNLATALAQSLDFQDWLGVLNDTDALARIGLGGRDAAELPMSGPRPYLLIDLKPDSEQTRTVAVASDVLQAQVEIFVAADVSADNQDSSALAQAEARDKLDGLLAILRGLNGSDVNDAKLDMRDFQKSGTRLLPTPESEAGANRWPGFEGLISFSTGPE